MVLFLTVFIQAALILAAYLGVHYTCAWWLPLSSAGYTIAANITVLALIAACARLQRAPLSAAVGARRMPAQAWWCAVGAGVGMCLLVLLMMLTVPFPRDWTQQYAERVEHIGQAPVWLRYLSSVAVAPLAEETVFRGLIYRRLKDGMPRAVAAVLSAIAFAALHGTIVWMLYTFVLGILLAWLYERTRSLWACVVCHTVFNIVGQIPFISYLPDVAIIGVFTVGTAMFVWSLWCLQRMTPTEAEQ